MKSKNNTYDFTDLLIDYLDGSLSKELAEEIKVESEKDFFLYGTIKGLEELYNKVGRNKHKLKRHLEEVDNNILKKLDSPEVIYQSRVSHSLNKKPVRKYFLLVIMTLSIAAFLLIRNFDFPTSQDNKVNYSDTTSQGQNQNMMKDTSASPSNKGENILENPSETLDNPRQENLKNDLAEEPPIAYAPEINYLYHIERQIGETMRSGRANLFTIAPSVRDTFYTNLDTFSFQKNIQFSQEALSRNLTFSIFNYDTEDVRLVKHNAWQQKFIFSFSTTFSQTIQSKLYYWVIEGEDLYPPVYGSIIINKTQ